MLQHAQERINEKWNSMAIAEHFRLATEKEKTEAVARLVKLSTGDFDFYSFAILGIAMATFGLILDTPEVIIGSMLIAPVLYPLMSLSLALVLVDTTLMYRSARTLLISFSVSIAIAFTLTLLLSLFSDLSLGEQVIARAKPSLLFFLVAFISGLAATYSLVLANLNETLPGVAISVSLVPPLAVVGVGLGAGDVLMAGKAFVLFLINVGGIALASMLTFTLMDLYNTRKIALSAVRQEDKRLKAESEKIQEIKEGTSNNE
jgi:uncharacterized hydrophobic protein (TIGR00271 family)